MNRRCLYRPFVRAADGSLRLENRREKRCPNRATVRLHGGSTGMRIKVCRAHADLYIYNHWLRGWPA